MQFIEKEELKKRFINKDWNYVLDVCAKVSHYILETTYKYNNISVETREDIVQDCTLDLWRKIQQDKVDPENNIFSLVYKNSNFRILDFLRKEKNRRKKATFISYDEFLENTLGNEEGALGEII